MRSRVLLVAVLVLLLPAVAVADPRGRTTLEETLAPAPGAGFAGLQPARGERYVVRRGGSAKASRGRRRERRSLLMFAQLTDPQVVDEMSPARVDFADPAGNEARSAHRPQEVLGLHAFDSV